MMKPLTWALNAALCIGMTQAGAADSNKTTTPMRAPADATSSTSRSENPVLDGEVDPATLRFVADGRGARLIGDLLLTLAPGAEIATAQDEKGSAIEVRVASDLNGADDKRVRLRGLDLSSGSVLSVTYVSGQTVSGRLPGLAVDVEMSAGPQVGDATAADLDAAWSALLVSMGARAVERPAGFAYLARWSVAGAPHFAATKNDRASREDMNQVASVLNHGVYKRGDKAALTLDRAMTAIEWRDGAAAPKSSREVVHTSVFDDAKRPSERKVALTLRDAFGKSVERHVKIHSHGLVDAAARELPALVTALAGVNADELAAPDVNDPDASYLPLASERSALNRLFVSSARDGIVTPDELGVQVRLARQIASK